MSLKDFLPAETGNPEDVTLKMLSDDLNEREKHRKDIEEEFDQKYDPSMVSDTATKLLLNRTAAISKYAESIQNIADFAPYEHGLYNGLILALNFINGSADRAPMEATSEEFPYKAFPACQFHHDTNIDTGVVFSHPKKPGKHVLMHGMKDGKKETALLYEVNKRKYYTVSRHAFERDYKNMKKETQEK